MNPYREAAPWARAITLCALGAAAFYLLGRWEAAVDRRLEQLRSETASVVELIQARRAEAERAEALEDSLRTLDRALEKQEEVTRAVLEKLEGEDSTVVEWAKSAPLDSLMPLLQMRPLQLGETTFYAATGGRVRILAEGMLRLPIAEERIRSLERLVATQRSRVGVANAGWESALGRATRAEEALDLAEPLLEAWQDYSGCKILGIVSCPSRTVSFVVGAFAGVTIAYIGTRE